MSGGRKGRGCEAPQDDQEWYQRQNATQIIAEKNRKISRLREQVTRLEKSNRDLRLQLQRALEERNKDADRQ